MVTATEKRTIFIIDDNPQFAEDLRALTGEEFQLLTAGSGEERECANFPSAASI